MRDRPLDRLIDSLAQKPPFRFVDHVLSVESHHRAEGTVTFALGHPIFEGHLPGEPLVPGVIVIEALAQLAGLALAVPDGEEIRGYLAEVGQTRFYRLIRPGEEILLAAEVVRAFGEFARFTVKASVGGEMAVSGTLTLARSRR
jgi:3-hydroxyacyl-[acyl-carrier-protein] dehydratase